MKIKPEDRIWIGIYGFTAFIMLIAISVFGWLAWTSLEEPGHGEVAGTRTKHHSVGPIPTERFDLLAQFPAPQYVAEPGAPAAFETAMASYQKRDYTAAVALLRKVVNAHPDFAPAHFYLGISLLLAGDRKTGIGQLQTIITAGSSDYLERARFYLAKAYIGEHDIPQAEKQLSDLIEQHGDLEKQATILLAQIGGSPHIG